jgi:nicotinate-nucleotide adenylyltransferase
MPNQELPHKETLNGVSGHHRSEMVKRAIADHSKFKLQSIELERSGRSYTFDTMKLLTERYDYRFSFIIGADMIEYLPNWYKIEELVKIVSFVGVNRPEYDKQSDYPIIYVDVPNIEISSLMIRNRLKAGKSIRYLVPDSVSEYIEENRLYES